MRILAIDHGDKRTGLAISDAAGTLASPHSVIETQNETYLIDCIAGIVEKEAIEAIVVGLPLNMDGSEGPRAKRVRAFAGTLSAMISVPIDFYDERLSSFSADALFRDAGLTRKDKKKCMDAVAASVFLQGFLDSQNVTSDHSANPRLVRDGDTHSLAKRAVMEFTRAAQAAVSERGAFFAAVSGGRTPRLFFERLARPADAADIPWDKTHLFWADERCVPPESPDSNYRLAVDTFLDAVPIPPQQVYRVHGEYDDCRRAADAYEATLKMAFDVQEGQVPCFDLIVLGLGEDGHIASLLPGDPGVSIADQLTWPVFHKTRLNRVTLTAPVLQHARTLLVMVSGLDKAQIVQTLFSSPPDVQRFPAYVLWPVIDKVLWLIDDQAASLL